MVALSVHERMKGYVDFGATECEAGARAGLAAGTAFAHSLTIKIADIDRFVSTPTHDATLVGHIECEKLGGTLEIQDGTYNMVVDAEDPLVKCTFYRVVFADKSQKYTMLGNKTLRDDRGADLWSDVTALEIRIYLGEVFDSKNPTSADGESAASATSHAMGVLQIGFFDGMKSALSFECTGTKIERVVAIKKFCGFYGSRLWDLYARLKPREARANEWTATDAFRASQRMAPVKWLLAGDLLRRAARIARSTLGNELDLRDWMTHDQPVDFRHEKALDGEEARSELWFDYIADTGDDPQVMEVMAKLLGQPFPKDITRDVGVEAPTEELQVGPFIFVGGDTAYHVADETTLRLRFVEPFKRALGVTGDPHQKIEVTQERHLFGIPGNHDYYDNLVGFNRMFRKPFHQHAGVLQIPGFPLRQEASYVKILLPGGWQLWGADLANGLDYRQWRYFGTKVPDKLILCVATPPVTFDHVRVPVKDEYSEETKAYRRMFGVQESVDLELDPTKLGKQLDKVGACRLHIAGDDHHYARYDDGNIPASAATIVSGGGGAFLHPTETSRGEVTRQKSYPATAVSAKLSAQLVNPLVVFSAGLVYLVGAVLGALLYATHPGDWRELGPAAMWNGALIVMVLALLGGVKVNKRVALARKRIAKANRPVSPHEAPSPEKPELTASEADEAASDRRWSHRLIRPLVWTFVIVLVSCAPFLAQQIDPAVDPLSKLSAFLFVSVLMVFVLALLARSRGCNAGVGFLHGVVQVGLPLSIAVASTRLGLAFVVAGFVLFGLVAAPLYCKGKAARWPLALLWFVQGPAMVGVLWIVWWMGWSTPVFPNMTWMIAVAALIGAVVVTMQFGWYLLMSSAFGAHNNEVGAAVRTTEYKQWIRFHVTKERVTGYVIGVDRPKDAGLKNLARVRLVDVFHVAPRPVA